jgi:hypothetical protein
MKDDRGSVTIRSYRVCFKLERRIHKIDRWRLPVPFGVPLRGVGYAAAVLGVVLILGRLPGIGEAAGAIHPAIRFLVIPVTCAYLLCMWEIDGRPAHAGLIGWARYFGGPRRLAAFRPVPRPEPVVRMGEIAFAPDESGPRLRRGAVRGPSTAVLRYPYRGRPAGRTLYVVHQPGPAQWRGKQVALREGERIVFR